METRIGISDRLRAGRKAMIGYEGKDYELSAGECFRFEKNGLHSVTANSRFKMALLLILK